jgi:hypothetical protein
MKNAVFVGYDAYGDFISNNGFIRYVSEKYDNLYLPTHFEHYVNLLFNDKENIHTINYNQLNNMIQNSQNFDYIDVRIWEKYEMSNIKPELIKGTYFDKDNKIGAIENQEVDDNASSFYSYLGMPINTRLDNFHFDRLLHQENILFDRLDLYNKDYAVVCEYGPHVIDRKYIGCDNIINLHHLAPTILELIKVIENAKEVHLLENSISLLVYHMQYKKLMKNININFHYYARLRSDFLTNMVRRPELENWNFIY